MHAGAPRGSRLPKGILITISLSAWSRYQPQLHHHPGQVSRVYQDVESAKAAGLRPQFTAMLAALRKEPHIAGVISHKVDRLLRNFAEFAVVDEYRVSSATPRSCLMTNRFALVKKGWELLASGQYSLRELSAKLLRARRRPSTVSASGSIAASAAASWRSSTSSRIVRWPQGPFAFEHW